MPVCDCQLAFVGNPPALLHPVDLWVEILVDGEWVKAIRDQFLESKNHDRTYRCENGEILQGQFNWRYK